MNKKDEWKFSSADKTADTLFKAAGKYIDAHGGSAIVAGGIGLIYESDFKFKLVISITGRPPIYQVVPNNIKKKRKPTNHADKGMK